MHRNTLTNAQLQDAFVDTQTRTVEVELGALCVNRFDHKLLVVERDV